MSEPAHLAATALRPDYLCYLIYYTRPGRVGWSIAVTWSPDSVELVREWFHYDFYDERPTIVAVQCLSHN